MNQWLIEQYKCLIASYWADLNKAEVKGRYNKVFNTYSTTQRDVQMKYKTLFATLFAMADKFGISLEEPDPMKDLVIEEPKDEVLG